MVWVLSIPPRSVLLFQLQLAVQTLERPHHFSPSFACNENCPAEKTSLISQIYARQGRKCCRNISRFYISSKWAEKTGTCIRNAMRQEFCDCGSVGRMQLKVRGGGCFYVSLCCHLKLVVFICSSDTSAESGRAGLLALIASHNNRLGPKVWDRTVNLKQFQPLSLRAQKHSVIKEVEGSALF